MARKIVVLEQVSETGDFNVVFWLDVPLSRQRFHAVALGKSAFLDATALELTAIQNGAVKEVFERFNRPNGTTQGALRTALGARHAELQAAVTTDNPWNRYGSSYDGVTWTAVAVA